MAILITSTRAALLFMVNMPVPENHRQVFNSL
jgi:hypothetical protein